MPGERPLTGAKVVLAEVGPGISLVPAGTVDFTAHLGGPLTLGAEVRSIRTGPDGIIVGLEFCAGQDAERAELALALFHSDADPERVPDRVGSTSSTVAA